MLVSPFKGRILEGNWDWFIPHFFLLSPSLIQVWKGLHTYKVAENIEAGSTFVPAQKANHRAYVYMLSAGLLNVQTRISSTVGRNFLIFYKRKAPIILSPHDHLFCPLVDDA